MSAHWRPVSGWEGMYEVSHDGQVRSVRTGIVLRQSSLPKGYRQVCLQQRPQGRKETALVHALVMAAFVGPRPPGMQTRHLDGDPSNNHVSNLRYGTQADNNRDAVRHGTRHTVGADPSAWAPTCTRGHLFTPANTAFRLDKGVTRRTCVACRRESSRRYKARERQKATATTPPPHEVAVRLPVAGSAG